VLFLIRIEFSCENNVYCERLRWLNAEARGSPRASTNQPQEQAIATPETLHGLSAVPGQNGPKPHFTVHAYSLDPSVCVDSSRLSNPDKQTYHGGC
jgi:hypothetical protein